MDFNGLDISYAKLHAEALFVPGLGPLGPTLVAREVGTKMSTLTMTYYSGGVLLDITKDGKEFSLIVPATSFSHLFVNKKS